MHASLDRSSDFHIEIEDLSFSTSFSGVRRGHPSLVVHKELKKAFMSKINHNTFREDRISALKLHEIVCDALNVHLPLRTFRALLKSRDRDMASMFTFEEFADMVREVSGMHFGSGGDSPRKSGSLTLRHDAHQKKPRKSHLDTSRSFTAATPIHKAGDMTVAKTERRHVEKSSLDVLNTRAAYTAREVTPAGHEARGHARARQPCQATSVRKADPYTVKLHVSDEAVRAEYIINMKSVLGKGSFGKVFRGTTVGSSKVVAIKELTNEFEEFETNWRCTIMLKEVQEHLRRCPYIYKILHIAEERKRNKYWHVFEYVEGISLHKIAHERKELVHRDQNLKVWFSQLFSAVQYLNYKLYIVHRDIKTDNVLIQLNPARIKLIDFDHATLWTEPITTSAGAPICLPPEVLSHGQHRYTPAADWWMIGVLLYDVITGRHPFLICKPTGSENSGKSTARRSIDYDLTEENIKAGFRGFSQSHCSTLPKSAQVLVHELLSFDPTTRLGFSSSDFELRILKHHFFSGVDWGRVWGSDKPPGATHTKRCESSNSHYFRSVARNQGTPESNSRTSQGARSRSSSRMFHRRNTVATAADMMPATQDWTGSPYGGHAAQPCHKFAALTAREPLVDECNVRRYPKLVTHRDLVSHNLGALDLSSTAAAKYGRLHLGSSRLHQSRYIHVQPTLPCTLTRQSGFEDRRRANL